MKHTLLIFFCSIVVCSAQADPQICVRRFKVSTTHQAPTYIPDRKKGGTGLSFDLIKELESRMGCRFSLDAVRMPRAFEDLKNHRIDIFAFRAPDPTWGQYGTYIPLYRAARILVVNKSIYSAEKKISDYLNDPKIKFGDQIGGRFFYLENEIQKLKSKGQLIQSPGPDHIYEMLRENRIQASFSSPAFHKYFMAESGLGDKLIAIRDPMNKVTIGMYISKRRVSKKEEGDLRAAVKHMQEDGVLKSIVSKYVDPVDLQHYELP